MTRAEEIERYRSAAELALRQLEWCVAYFHRIRKKEIANSIDRNRASIEERLRR